MPVVGSDRTEAVRAVIPDVGQLLPGLCARPSARDSHHAGRSDRHCTGGLRARPPVPARRRQKTTPPPQPSTELRTEPPRLLAIARRLGERHASGLVELPVVRVNAEGRGPRRDRAADHTVAARALVDLATPAPQGAAPGRSSTRPCGAAAAPSRASADARDRQASPPLESGRGLHGLQGRLPASPAPELDVVDAVRTASSQASSALRSALVDAAPPAAASSLAKSPDEPSERGACAPSRLRLARDLSTLLEGHGPLGRSRSKRLR